MVSKRAAAVAAGGAAVVIVAVALSGGSSKKSPSTAASPPSTAPTAAPDWSRLVAKISCEDSGRIAVSGYDPGSWALVATAAFPSPVGVATRIGGGIALDVAGGIAKLCPAADAAQPGATDVAVAGELFDPQFQRMSVQIFKAGSYTHVGYVTRAGELVDVTALDQHPGPSASTEGGPVFSVDGKTLVFTGTASNGARPLAARDVTTGARTELGTLSGDVGAPVLLAGSGVRAVAFGHGEEAVPSPAGTAIAMAGAVGDTSLNVWHLPTSGPADGHGRVGVLHQVAGSGAEPWQLAACTPLGWADPSTVLCEAAGAAQDLGAPKAAVYTVKVDGSAASGDGPRAEESAAAVGAPLIPPAPNRFVGEELLIGGDLWCVQVDGGTAQPQTHAQTVPLVGGTPHPVPAADPAFAARGYFLNRGAAR